MGNEFRPDDRGWSRRTVLGGGLGVLACAVVTGCAGNSTRSGEVVSENPEDARTERDEPYRPQFHYSMAEGRLADPNGLVFLDGIYHLFHQTDGRWGHATSPDLVRWDPLPIALEHDALGQALSGSAVVDRDNTSGLFASAPGLVAAYTSTVPTEAQSIAYSADQGRSWQRYAGNPVLANEGRKDFRDPKISWHAPSQRWIMVVSVGPAVSFFGSEDLLRWDFLSTFGEGHGLHTAVWECPNLTEVTVEGTDAKQWVLVVSVGDSDATEGSTMQYFVGGFDGTTFTPLDPPDTVLVVDFGQDFYAAQIWSDTRRERPVWIAWMGNWRYPYALPTGGWKGVMSIPRELALVTTAAGLRLQQTPVPELTHLRGEVERLPAQDIAGEVPLAMGADSMEFVLEYRPGPGRSGLRVLAEDTNYVEIGVDLSDNTLYVDREPAGLATVNDRSGRPFRFGGRRSAALGVVPDVVRLRGFVDRSTVEIFDADQHVLSVTVFPTRLGNGIRVFSDQGVMTLETLTVYRMKSIWAN